jgi:uncharacterized iron-regulated membrane protein
MRARTIKIWHLVHKWTSLVCTLFLLMLCLTGLPLIFYEEIDHLTGNIPTAEPMPPGTPLAPADRIVAEAHALFPTERVHYLSWDEHEPDLVYATLQAPGAPPDEFRFLAFDARTAKLLLEPNYNSGFMHVMLTLHIDLFAVCRASSSWASWACCSSRRSCRAWSSMRLSCASWLSARSAVTARRAPGGWTCTICSASSR